MAAYVKDIDGRFLHINECFRKSFEVELDDIRGRTDDELAPERTIDGPRRAAGNVTEDEPLQLEYTVPPFDGRPALAVWRFAVRVPEGDLVGVCGVAAPVAGSPLARRECERLMAVTQGTEEVEPELPAEETTPSDEHRIAALHDASASAARRAHELLAELAAERELRAEAEARAADRDELRRRGEAAEAAALAERERADEADAAAGRERERADAATAATAAERSRADESVAELSAARAELAQRTHTETEIIVELRRRLDEATGAAHAERSRADEAAALLSATRAELEASQAGLASARDDHAQDEAEATSGLRQNLAHAEATAQQERERADAAEAAVASERADAAVRLGVSERRITELEASLANARAHELEITSERGTSGPHWDASAQRAFTTALANSSDWRVGIKAAIGVIGDQGGWDAVCAWQPDDRHGFASCFAMWTGENRRLSALETATWQRRQPLTESTIGEALDWEESRWLAADPHAEDRRLQLLAQHGIRGALILPVREGAGPVAALELLTVGATEPSRELVEAIETIALQLGHFSHLLSAGAQPHWRFGRA